MVDLVLNILPEICGGPDYPAMDGLNSNLLELYFMKYPQIFLSWVQIILYNNINIKTKVRLEIIKILSNYTYGYLNPNERFS